MSVIKAPVLFHTPTVCIGVNLPPLEKAIYDDIKIDINKLLSKEPIQVVLFSIVRKFNKTDMLGMDESIPVLKCVIKYIRHCLCDIITPMLYYKHVQLCDALIRKCGIRAHVLIGRKRFLQTLSLTARRWKNFTNDEIAQESADFTFDCLQSWYNAFKELKDLFPEYRNVYFKLVFKYRIEFPRSEDDPSRLPIVLEQADDEALLARGPDEFLLTESIDANPDISYGGVYGNGEDEESEGYFREELMNQDELRAIEHKGNVKLGDEKKPHHHDQGQTEDYLENASFIPPSSSSPSSSPVIGLEKRTSITLRQQTVSQKSFKIRRSGNPESNAANKAKSFKILRTSDNEEEQKDGDVNLAATHGHEDNGSNKGSEGSSEEQSITIENRAFVVDGRIGIDTRAVLSPSGKRHSVKGNVHFSVSSGGSDAEKSPVNNNHSNKVSHVYNPHDQSHHHSKGPDEDKAKYDHYKSDSKQNLHSVDSHLFNQKSVRHFTNIEDRIDRFNASTDSQDIQRSASHQSIDSGNNSTSAASKEKKLTKVGSQYNKEGDENVEIRFFGNQRVVIKKGEKPTN